MVMNVADVTSLYKKSGGLSELASGAPASKAGDGDFSTMVKDFLGDAVSSIREGEKATVSAATGKADLASVISAMNNAEIMLTEITAIRDKVIAAYQTITSSSI